MMAQVSERAGMMAQVSAGDVEQCEAATGGALQPEEDEGVHGEEVAHACLALYEPEKWEVAEGEQER